MVIKKRIFILLAILVFICLCALFVFLSAFPAPTPPEPTPPPPDWFTDWLHEPYCQPPCWEGITPGVTTMTETVIILKGIPGVSISAGPERPLPGEGDVEVWWDFSSPSHGGGRAVAFDNGLLRDLSLGRFLSTPLQDVINSYGFPSHVFISSCDHGKCSTNLIYMSSGLSVTLLLDWEDEPDSDVTISPNDEVADIEFFIPGEDGYLTAHPQYSQSIPKWTYAWVGYTKYRFR